MLFTILKAFAYVLVLGISIVLIISILTGAHVLDILRCTLEKMRIEVPNQGNFWKYQPICFEYSNKIESINGKDVPIKISQEYELDMGKYIISKTDPGMRDEEITKKINSFLSAHLYKPEEKTLSYYDFVNPIFFKVWNIKKIYDDLLGTVSINPIKCVLDGVELCGYYGDHLCTHSKCREMGIAPGMIQLLYDSLNHNYIENINENGSRSEKGLPVIFFRVDHYPLVHGQKPLCILDYKTKEVTGIKKTNENGVDSDVNDDKDDEIDWKRWHNVYLESKFSLKSIFYSLDDFKNHFSHPYLKKYQSPDGKMLILFCESWKNKPGVERKQKIYEIYDVFIDDFEDFEWKEYVGVFEKWLSSKNDSDFLIVSNNCGNKYKFCESMYKYGFYSGHSSYLYVFNLNFTRLYHPREIRLSVL